MKKNWISLLLALALMLTACCAMADVSACPGGVSLPASGVIDEGKYCLAADESYDYGISVEDGETVSICLHGHTLECTGLFVESGSVLKLYDCSGGKGSLITSGIRVREGSRAELYDIDLVGIPDSGTGVLVGDDGSEVFISGGSISGFDQGVYCLRGKVTIDGCKIENNMIGMMGISSDVTISGDAVVSGGMIGAIISGGEAIISGGVIEGTDSQGSLGLAIAEAKMKISKGEFKGKTLAAARLDMLGQTYEPLGEESIADGSYLAEGSFGALRAVVDYLPSAGGLPQTGDHSRFALWLMMIGLAGAGMFLLRRRAHI